MKKRKNGRGQTLPREEVDVSSLHPHPRNYRSHPEDQLEHIMESIRSHGIYRNVVISRDGTILAGHGVVEAVQKMGIERIPVVRLDLDPDDPVALKVMTGDNEIGHLGEIDDRQLSELLKEIHESNDELIDSLLGTGYDAQMLATLAMVSRPASEIADFDAATEWVGMPEFTPAEEPLKIIISFRNNEDRKAFVEKVGLKIDHRGNKWTTWWPSRERRDLASLKFEG